MTIRTPMPFAGPLLRALFFLALFLLALLPGFGGGAHAEGPNPAAPAPAAPSPAGGTGGLPAADIAAAQARLSPDGTLRTVDFAETGTTTVSGKITGYKAAAYAVPVKAGQTLTVSMTTRSTSAYFNVVDVHAPNAVAAHRGEVDGPKAAIRAPAATIWLIEPYLVRAAARRGSTADYKLTITRQ